MNIDWNNFTPWTSLLGGLFLGLASALFILLNGRILGVSGILSGLIHKNSGDTAWRMTFILGLLLSPVVMRILAPVEFLRAPRIDASMAMVVLAGILVGFGTRLGSGCTSGHGVCGLSRLSPRSMVATGVFMTSGFITVFWLKHFF